MKRSASCLVILVCCSRVACSQGDPASNESYSHVLYSQMVRGLLGELVLHRISPITDATKDTAVKKVAPLSRSLGNSIRGVIDGQAVFWSGGSMVLIDLNSGERENLKTRIANPPVVDTAGRQLFYSVGCSPAVWRFDMASRAETMVFSHRSEKFEHGHPAIALSPDGKRLAVATAGGTGESILSIPYEIHILDLTQDPPEAKSLGRTFDGYPGMTPDPDHPPATFWMGPTQLYVASPNCGLNAPYNQPSHFDVWKVDVATSEIDHVFDIPGKANDRVNFWQRADGQLMMDRSSVGGYRLDDASGEAIEDGDLSDLFTVKRGPSRPALFAGKAGLARAVDMDDISISPDGKQAIWFVSKSGKAPWNPLEPRPERYVPLLT